ncbi:processed acidic surface protein [Priestia megaterium]|nr:processed acidic surface protein [Priestia megaterium]
MKKWVSFLVALLLVISSLPAVSFAAQSKTFETDLTAYLKRVSESRGFEVSKEDIEYSLGLYDEELANFETVADLEDFLGEVIAADLHNLEGLYADYDLDEASLHALLEENGEALEDYVFVDNLDETLWFYLADEDEEYEDEDEEYTEEIDGKALEDALTILQEEFGLTNEELDRIDAYFMSLEDELADPAVLDRLMDLGERLAAFEDFETTTELTSDQIAELMSMYNEMLSIFKMKTSFTLVQDGSEKALSLIDLMNIEELKNASLKISLYTLEETFLADMVITGEMIDSDTVVNTGKELEQSAEKASETVENKAPVKKQPQEKQQVSSNKKVQKTVKGARLPDTASNYVTNALIGLVFIAFGFLAYRKVRRL